MTPLLRLLQDHFWGSRLGLLFGFAVAGFRRCRCAPALPQGNDRAALRNAFAVGIFERVFLARHDDAPIAQARARDGQFAAEAILGIGSDAAAAGRHIVSGRLELETGRAAAQAAAQLTAIAHDVDGGPGCLRDRWDDVGKTASARIIQMRVGRTHALAARIAGAADAGT